MAAALAQARGSENHARSNSHARGGWRVELSRCNPCVRLDEPCPGSNEVTVIAPARARLLRASGREGVAARKSSRCGTRLLFKRAASPRQTRSRRVAPPIASLEKRLRHGLPLQDRARHRTRPFSSSNSGSTAPRSTLTTSSQGAPGSGAERTMPPWTDADREGILRCARRSRRAMRRPRSARPS